MEFVCKAFRNLVIFCLSFPIGVQKDRTVEWKVALSVISSPWLQISYVLVYAMLRVPSEQICKTTFC